MTKINVLDQLESNGSTIEHNKRLYTPPTFNLNINFNGIIYNLFLYDIGGSDCQHNFLFVLLFCPNMLFIDIYVPYNIHVLILFISTSKV